MINNLNSLKEKIETLLFKYNEQKKINQDLETKIEYLNKSNQDLEKKIKLIQAKEKQLKLISAIPNESENKQYFKNKIDDRLYPLTVDRSQEFYFREAAKLIEATIKNLEDNYSVRDKQDLLAMSCIQFAAKSLQNKSKINDSDNEVEKIILKMINNIDNSI